MTKNPSIILARYATALAAVLLITFFYLHTHRFNSTTVALTYFAGHPEAFPRSGASAWPCVCMSLAATLAYNHYFLPPTRAPSPSPTLENWFALVTFLVTSVLASDLATRARNQAAEANRRRREVERLYKFSQRLLSAGNPIELLNAIPRQMVEIFEVGAAAIFLSDKQKIYRSGMNIPQLDEVNLKAIVAREDIQIDEEHSVCFAPLRLGARILGSVGISGPVLSRQSLEALGSLIAVATERAHAIEMVGRTEAAREGERLKIRPAGRDRA